MILKKIALLCLLIIVFSCENKGGIQFIDSSNSEKVAFSIEKIKESLKDNSNFTKKNANIAFEFLIEASATKDQGYKIDKSDTKITIKSNDVNGLMYGGFEVAEQIALHGNITTTFKNPYLKKRGIKFNIPLDARTPSYDDSGDAAQKNIIEMWDFSFWEEFLDQMAWHRYNILTLWNPHPFPSMIKMSNYPDVALNDIHVTTLKPVGVENEWAEPQMVSSNVVENVEVVKTMTIEEKISFWKKVMQYAKDRGIDIYYFTWNICLNGAANPLPAYYRTYKQPLWDERPSKYGINNQMDNPENIKYLREAVGEFLKTYPNIKGIGVTAGEHMLDVGGPYNREEWIWKTYGKGIEDVKKIQPNRKIDFIHRVWNTDVSKIMNYWKDYPDSFDASFKYAKARLYSSPFLNFADSHIEYMKAFDLKSWWNLRNDDIFVYRWGDSDYVRSFIEHFPKDHTAGFYMGSDGYVWGKEFISKTPELSGQLEINKHWYNFMLWGRLSYDTKLDSSFFVKKLKHHFQEANAQLLFETWQTASKIIPKVNTLHWQDWDYQWSVEACIDARIGFHTVEKFMRNRTLAGSGILNPMEYAEGSLENSENSISPIEIIIELKSLSVQTLKNIKELKVENNSTELEILIEDMEAMAYLGQYYATKIEATVELALMKVKRDESHRRKAIVLLEQAVRYWEMYTKVSEQNYKSQMLARTKALDWRLILEEVKKDIDIAKKMSF